MSEDRCICCGAIIPEGVSVCPSCLLGVKPKKEQRKMATEKRLIDVEDALRRMEKAEHLMHKINGIKAVDIGAVRQFFGMLKPVDAVEVVHGRWVQCKDWDYDYECSICEGYAGEDIDGNYNKLTPYCPNCGAKMDGDGNG